MSAPKFPTFDQVTAISVSDGQTVTTDRGSWFEFSGNVFVSDGVDLPLDWWPFIEWLASRPAGTALANLSLIELKTR